MLLTLVDEKNTKIGFSCLRFLESAVWITVCLWIKYLSIWNYFDEMSDVSK